ncbi:MAG: lysine biosynthesis protein LysW [Candidatus Omnitrophica bacterium]|jgi:lysine biosynthesis protein LysW|nr:lysine biosynthesis protein LysW [Candidatus Omnitrophota bacterium]
MPKVRMVKCPECGGEFEFEDYLEIGDTTFCGSCDMELKIIRLDPPQVEVVKSLDDESDLDEEGDAEEF